jgi:hypothetical protein
MVQLIASIIILSLVVFYFWMFWEMSNNDSLPSHSPSPLRWPPISKSDWLVMFVFLNVLAAGYYYFTVYKEK